MGKRLEDLHLSDQPIQPTTSSPSDRAAAAQVLADIEDMRGNGLYDWADDTLRDIGETVARTQTVTEGQRKAVTNIYESAKHPSRRRRYEGYRSRRW